MRQTADPWRRCEEETILVPIPRPSRAGNDFSFLTRTNELRLLIVPVHSTGRSKRDAPTDGGHQIRARYRHGAESRAVLRIEIEYH